MYKRRYGLIRTLAPLHVGASAGEEAGNLNLIFRDAYTQTGIIPGSSIRGRFRAEMRRQDTSEGKADTNYWYGYQQAQLKEATLAEEEAVDEESRFSEGKVKFEYGALVWIPVFCPGQPVVWASCPRLLRRHARITGMASEDLEAIKKLANIGSQSLQGSTLPAASAEQVKLFFNLGFLTITLASNDQQDLLEKLAPIHTVSEMNADQLVVVDDASISAIHDMALYRQSRVKLRDDAKLVQFFFNVEALPEGSILSFPIAINQAAEVSAGDGSWIPLANGKGAMTEGELYFGGLESIGFGRCHVEVLEVRP
jgi:CRISPR-associated protein Cmr4